MPTNTLPALSHGEAVDMFPILRKLRDGFGQGAPGQPDRILDRDQFMQAACVRGHGAASCARIILSLVFNESVQLGADLTRIDSEHRKGVAKLFRAITDRGMK